MRCNAIIIFANAIRIYRCHRQRQLENDRRRWREQKWVNEMQFARILFDKNSEKYTEIMKKRTKLYKTKDVTMEHRQKKGTRTNMDWMEKEESENKTIFRVTNRQTIEMRASLLFAWFVLLQFHFFFLFFFSIPASTAEWVLAVRCVMSIFGN